MSRISIGSAAAVAVVVVSDVVVAVAVCLIGAIKVRCDTVFGIRL